MKPGLRVCQFIPALNRGDAMSGQAIAIHRAVEAYGMASAIFVFSDKGNDRSLPTELFAEYESHEDDVIMVHYGGRGSGEDFALNLPGRVFLYYHNITPAKFFERIGVSWSEGLRWGRDSLPGLTRLGGLAATEYNKREMIRAGFRDVHVLPYFLDFEEFTRAADTPAAREVVENYQIPGVVHWLHVGRIVPNKRTEDIVRAFYIYHTRINSKSNLIFVGSDVGFEAYSHPLREWIKHLGIAQAVIFTGQINDRNQVAGFFKLADLYMCMSEHEGFCIPLLEAMVHSVPIIACRSTGVTYTMGGAGVVVDDKDPRLLAHGAHLLCSRADYREGIIRGQLAQAQVWHPDRALQALHAWLDTL